MPPLSSVVLFVGLLGLHVLCVLGSNPHSVEEDCEAFRRSVTKMCNAVGDQDMGCAAATRMLRKAGCAPAAISEDRDEERQQREEEHKLLKIAEDHEEKAAKIRSSLGFPTANCGQASSASPSISGQDLHRLLAPQGPTVPPIAACHSHDHPSFVQGNVRKSAEKLSIADRTSTHENGSIEQAYESQRNFVIDDLTTLEESSILRNPSN